MARSSNVIFPAYLSESNVGSGPLGSTSSAVASTWNSSAGKLLRSGLSACGPPFVNRLKGRLNHSASCLSNTSLSRP